MPIPNTPQQQIQQQPVTRTQQAPVAVPQPSPTGYRSPTIDYILNAQKPTALKRDVRTQADMDAWKQNHFVPDPKLAGDSPRDAMNRWAITHGGAQPAQQPASRTEQPAQQHKTATYEEMYRALKDQIDEQTAKDEKKQQRDLNIKSIGDMFNALSNLYFTTQYAPSWYSDKSSMTDRQRERYDKLNAARDANNQNYINMMMNAREKDRQQENADRAIQFQKENADREAALKRDQFNFTVQNAKDQREAAAEEAKKGREFTAHENAENRKTQESIAGMRGGGTGTGRHNRTEPVPLSNGKTGKEELKFKISPSLWNTSVPAIYSILKEDLGDYPGSDEDQENYIFQNWYKSDKVAQMLMNLSMTDPDAIQPTYNPIAPPEPVQSVYTTPKAKRQAAKADEHRKKADEAEKNAVGTVVTPDPNRSVENAG